MLLATHTDAMSLIEENGGLGMLGIMSYFNHVPKVGAAAHADLLLRLPALHAGRRGQLAAVRLLHDSPRAAEVDRRDPRHRAHGRPADDRSRARRQPVRATRASARKTAASSPA